MSRRNRKNINQNNISENPETVVEDTKTKRSLNDLVKGALTSKPVKITAKVVLYGCAMIGGIAGASYMAGSRKSYIPVPRDAQDVEDPDIETVEVTEF